jgi:hypothetical protein
MANPLEGGVKKIIVHPQQPTTPEEELSDLETAYMDYDYRICHALGISYELSTVDDALEAITRLKRTPDIDRSKGFNVLEHRQEFVADASRALTERLQHGEERHGSYFKGDPLAQAWEEALDMMFYIWTARKMAGDNNLGSGFPAPTARVDKHGKETE